MEILEPFLELIKFERKETLPQTRAVFRALTEAIIPGALDLHIDQYPIWALDHLFYLTVMKVGVTFPLANATAEMLNIAARQLIDQGGNREAVNLGPGADDGAFTALEPVDRLRTLALLEDLQVDPAGLPIPFRYDPSFIMSVTGILALLTAIGCYSEWPGYGETRLKNPDKRKLEQFPPAWTMVGYPGPAKGYHALRGNPVNKFTE
ncbi:MAG TPA: hypothetical protein VHS59_10845 [Bacillota bacterium]|nr:hypothetical protein [Bacillota bacterium]